MAQVNVESLVDVALVGAGVLAFVAVKMILARANVICALATEGYIALARRLPRVLPLPFAVTTTRRGFVSVVRVLATTALAGAVVFSVAGAALVLVGVDALE
jgi:uncharacterized protein YybS (DUF2232 family)